jgi:hypothetical protein
MKKYAVTVEMVRRFSGTVEVEARSAEAAQTKVQARIDDKYGKSMLRVADVEWDDGTYEDFSLQTTGDVDEA